MAVSAPPRAPRRSARFGWVPALVGIACLVAGLAFAAFRLAENLSQPSAASVAKASARAAASKEAALPHVRYGVTGSSKRAALQVVTPEGFKQLSHVAVPLVTKSGAPYLEFVMKPGDPVGISAIAEDGGSITCTISLGDKVLTSQTAAGPGQAAACEGSIP